MNDGLMKRTQRRPLPLGALSRRHALVFAACTGLAGITILHQKVRCALAATLHPHADWRAQCNPTTAALGCANIVLYAAVYTPLKQLSVANTWVGALVGAIPPLMGWAAAAGQLEAGAGVLSALLYFWQLPHFMALAYLYRADYAAGGYRMLPIIDATGRRTAGVALRNALYMAPLGALACHLGVTTAPFAWEAAALSGVLAAGAGAFLVQPAQASARRLFLLSLLHLPVLQAASVLHRVPNTAEARAAAPASLAEWKHRHRERLAAEQAPAAQERVQGALLSGSLSFAPFPFLPAPPRVPRAACLAAEPALRS